MVSILRVFEKLLLIQVRWLLSGENGRLCAGFVNSSWFRVRGQLLAMFSVPFGIGQCICGITSLLRIVPFLLVNPPGKKIQLLRRAAPPNIGPGDLPGFGIMKIERVEVFGVAIPLRGERTIAYETRSVQRSVVVRITSDEGITGLGNVDPVAGYSSESADEIVSTIREEFAPKLVGRDPANMNLLLARLASGSTGFLDSRAAVEMACVDLVSRSRNISVSEYLGGAVKDSLLFNAWIGISSPEQAASEAAMWKGRGFRSAKIKLGGGVKADYDRIKAVREAVGSDFYLRADANAGYDVRTAIELARSIAVFDLQLLEQPVSAHDIEGMARVRREGGGIPIMADESLLDHASLIRIIRADAADLIKVKVMKQGGVLYTKQIMETAKAAGLRCVLGHGFALGVNMSAEMMLAGTCDCVIDGLESVGPLNISDDIITRPLDISGGSAAVPTGAGFGVTLDMEKIARYRFM